jgi:hypothetical protein
MTTVAAHQDDVRTRTNYAQTGNYSPRVVNAVARALGRLELAEQWAGVDHDMPGTTQREREVSRWAATQLLDELVEELNAPTEWLEDRGITPSVDAPRHGDMDTSAMLHAGPFQSLPRGVPAAEREELGEYSLYTATDLLMAHRAEEIYCTRMYEPQVMTDEELEAAYGGDGFDDETDIDDMIFEEDNT